MDYSDMLDFHIQKLSGLPPEINSIFNDISKKNENQKLIKRKINDMKEEIKTWYQKNPSPISKLDFESENPSLLGEIRSHYNQLLNIADEKIEQSERTVKLLDYYLKKLYTDDLISSTFNSNEFTNYNNNTTSVLNDDFIDEVPKCVTTLQQSPKIVNTTIPKDFSLPQTPIHVAGTPVPLRNQRSSRKSALSSSTAANQPSSVLKQSILKSSFANKSPSSTKKKRKNSNNNNVGNKKLTVNTLNNGGSGDDLENLISPDEPIYCTCRQVSFGDMIACDNEV
ncbi:hypothetical protein HK099_004930 [Clydaea vesicula]|uniref:Inhibitor of growth protein N-terminal histone-binding domain-containing protein n=1 Tax=Clydaea vesicula TaxID=447962 RepID=A0AAD5U1R1_9FUNG|nr:hypothetical protein HK099_004930 [Clydaea vesicula]